MKFPRNLKGRRIASVIEAKVRPLKRTHCHEGSANRCRNSARLGNKLHLCCGASVFEVSESKVIDVRCTNITPNSVSGLKHHKSADCRNAFLAHMTVPREDKQGNRLNTLEASVLTWWYSDTNIY